LFVKFGLKLGGPWEDGLRAIAQIQTPPHFAAQVLAEPESDRPSCAVPVSFPWRGWLYPSVSGQRADPKDR